MPTTRARSSATELAVENSAFSDCDFSLLTCLHLSSDVSSDRFHADPHKEIAVLLVDFHERWINARSSSSQLSPSCEVIPDTDRSL